jgi:hypothetical protein
MRLVPPTRQDASSCSGYLALLRALVNRKAGAKIM